MLGLIIIAIITILFIVYVVGTYNSLVGLRNKVKDNWTQVSVFLKRRYDLIPNLVETVKGYTKHEKETLEAVVSARNNAVNATTKSDEMKAAGELSNALGRLFALSESYPDLKANENFMDLQANLKETEDKISFARQIYNDSVLTYKNKLEMFPSNIIASLFKFEPEIFFEVSEEERKNVQVKF